MKHHQGFSLVELSIVLVIIGLLVGGVLTGQSLIHSAELRSITSEYERFKTAANTFHDQYLGLPGDLSNANSFWAAAANGDGNRHLDQAPAVSVAGERYGFWQQLALAGMIEGTYTGLATATNVNDAVPGTNVPRAKYTNAGWSISYTGVIDTTNLSWFARDYGNQLYFGAKTASGFTNTRILTPNDAWNIDTKIDDGKPGMGTVMTLESQGSATAGCSDQAASATAIESTSNYDLDNNAVACTLVLIM